MNMLMIIMDWIMNGNLPVWKTNDDSWPYTVLTVSSHLHSSSYSLPRVSFLALLLVEANAVLANIAAEGIGLVMRDVDTVLSNACHARSSMLYKQRFFVDSLPMLLAAITEDRSDGDMDTGAAAAGNANEDKDRRRAHYLAAVSQLARHVPESVLLPEHEQLLPLMARYLDLAVTYEDEQDLCPASIALSALETMTVYLDAGTSEEGEGGAAKGDEKKTPKQTVCRHLSTLVPLLLRLTK